MNDIGDLDGEQWDMALEWIPAVSILASHKLTQLCSFYTEPIRRLCSYMVGGGGILPRAKNVGCIRAISYI